MTKNIGKSKLILLQENFKTDLYDELYGKVLTDEDIDRYLEKEFTNVMEYIKKYSEKWGYRFWDDAIDAIAEAKKSRVRELENLKLIRKENSNDKLCLK